MIGQQISHYRILSLLGQGGMATVYRAEQLGLRRIVALKILHADLARDEVIVERFLREARIAASLNHEHIVTIYDVGEESGVYYIAMRYIEGESFAHLIRRDGPLPPARALAMLAQVADALDFAHAHGVLHRDVKPANVMVEPGDILTLTDFGIARAGALSALTAAHTVIGTPAYMSPEQARGEPVDKRSDLYALGVMLYEALGGRPPFVADSTPGLLYMHVHQPPRPLSELRPDLPWGLSAVVSRALAKQPDERYQSAHELIEAARAALTDWPPASDEPETAMTAPAPSVPPAWPPPSLPLRHTPVRPLLDGARAAPAVATPIPRPAQPSVPPYVPTAPPGFANQGGHVRPAAGQPHRPISPTPRPPAMPPRPPSAETAAGPAHADRLGADDHQSRSRRAWVFAVGLVSCAMLLVVGTYLVTRSGLLDRLAGTTPPAPTAIAVIVPTSTPRPAEPTPTPAPAPTAPVPTAVAQPTVRPPTVAPKPTLPPTPDLPARVARAQESVAVDDLPTAIRELELIRQDPAVLADRGLAAMVDETLRKAHLAHGNRLLEQGKLDDSYAQFKAILDIAPGDPDAIDGQKRVILAKNYQIMEANWDSDDEAAIGALEANMQIDAGYRETRPKLYALLIAKADRMLATGDRDGAYPVLMRALAIVPDRPEAMQRLRPYTPTPVPAPATRVPPTSPPYVPPSGPPPGPPAPFTPPGSPV